MTEWINQTFSMSLSSMGQGGKKEEIRFKLNGLDVVIETDVDNGMRFDLRPYSSREANQLAMIFRKTAKRFEEIGKDLEPKFQGRPEDDPSRSKTDREAWKVAR